MLLPVLAAAFVLSKAGKPDCITQADGRCRVESVTFDDEGFPVYTAEVYRTCPGEEHGYKIQSFSTKECLTTPAGFIKGTEAQKWAPPVLAYVSLIATDPTYFHVDCI